MTPNSSKSTWHEDGTVTVDYFADGALLQTRTYLNSREASIESSLFMFPGTSREWLERMHGSRKPGSLRNS